MFTDTNQPTQPTDRGGLDVPFNSAKSPYHQQSSTPQNTPQKLNQFDLQQQKQNQQQLSPFSTAAATTPTFNRFFERPTPTVEKTPYHMSVEYVLKQIPWLNADKLRSTLKKLPELTAHAAAQDQAPDPFLVDATEKRRDSMVRRSSNKPRHYISLDMVYICDTEEQNPSVDFRGMITNKQKMNYREGFSLSDGKNNRRHLKEYDDTRFLRIDGKIVADLSKTRDILDGYTCQIQYAGVFITIGWNTCPSVLLAAVRNNKDWSGMCTAIFMKNRRTLCMDRMRNPPIQSQPVSYMCMFDMHISLYCILLSLTLSLFDFQVVNDPVPPPTAAASVLEVPLSPVPPQVSPMRASTEAPTDSNIDVAALATANTKAIAGMLTKQDGDSKNMGRLEFNMNELVGAVSTGFKTLYIRTEKLEHNQHELWSNQEQYQKHNNSVHAVFDSRIKELENARRNGGGAAASSSPNASATASAVDEEMDDSSSPAPAPVPQVSAPQPAPSTDHEMTDSSPSKKMPSGAAAATPQASAVTSNEAASSPFASVSSSSSVPIVASLKKTTTPTKPTFNFGSTSTSNEAASSPFAPNVASSSVPVVASPKKISANCSGKTTTPTKAIFNMGFSPPPKEKPNPKNKIKGKKTARRSLKAMSRSSFASSSPKKKANAMRNNLVAEKRKKTAAPSPVKKPVSDISKSVTPKASNSVPVARRYGTELVNGAVRDWDDEINHTNNFCAEELVVVAGSRFKYDNVSQYCAELTSGLPNIFQKVAFLFQNVVDTDSYEKLVNEYITGLKTFRCGSEDRFEEEIKKGIDIAKLKGGM